MSIYIIALCYVESLCITIRLFRPKVFYIRLIKVNIFQGLVRFDLVKHIFWVVYTTLLLPFLPLLFII